MTIFQLVLSIFICNEVINVKSIGYYHVFSRISSIENASKHCNSDGRYLASAHNQQQIDKLQQLCQVFPFDYYGFLLQNMTKKIFYLSIVRNMEHRTQNMLDRIAHRP